MRQDSIKLLEENTGKTFSDMNCTNVSLGQPPKAIEIKAKINKWDLIKLKSFCTTKIRCPYVRGFISGVSILFH